MKVVKRIKNYFRNIRINKLILKYKFVHIMFNDKFNKPFVDFLNNHFNSTEHLVLCKRFFSETPFPQGDNVIEISSLKGLRFETNQKLICHSLFDAELVDYLYKHPNILTEKAYWAIWGGDLYQAKRDEKNDFVRSHFKGYLTDVDTEVAKKQYNLAEKPFYCIHAIFPISKNTIQNITKKRKDFTQIQINNSCDESTLQMLDVLAKFKEENIKITTILSYGKLEFKDEIIQKGRNIFKDKFEYLDTRLAPQEYALHLAQNDLLILNQNRQQGVGNTVASLALGNKVFIKSEISTYSKLKNFGLTVFDTNEIAKLNFDCFITNPCAKSNQERAMMFFDDEYKASLWRTVFNAE